MEAQAVIPLLMLLEDLVVVVEPMGAPAVAVAVAVILAAAAVIRINQ